jgi:hypothetical protein
MRDDDEPVNEDLRLHLMDALNTSDPLLLLIGALKMNNASLVACLATGLDLNSARHESLSPLAWAASTPRDPPCLEALMDAGARVDERSHDQQTALHRASMKPEPLLALTLLARGADV